MPLELVTIPCLSDNYAFLIHDAETGETALVDVPEAGPIKAELARRGWVLSHVLLTHHHWDHVDGLADLLVDHPAQVIGAAADAHRLPPLDQAVAEGDSITIGGETAQIFDVSGHTVGHIAFYFPDSKLLFTADSLMALGCGRLFEGTPDQMFDSLSKLAALPGDTTVCSGHEYTLSNAKFALTVDPDNSALISRVQAVQTARDAGQPTVPTSLTEELATNPFLRGHTEGVQKAVNMVGADPAQVFAEVRKRKDNF
ncbi:hydroxyacylglutathione hydrolase [Thalassovita litoralis]|jgi:hydroxyacylglutathione hydrolase|uniref:Hydroxyacylglutathione hydrolase n=1 Tax=Thalassovita litoralis TaxID=1010611 RepID=A0A521EUS0_9RHOB|nr:hydroxyacylglutathione hydrolase [Thalassovita litoralis]SMO87672.1 hydroxyacylglutathione hydrolase [Thalassovita litoralis]